MVADLAKRLFRGSVRTIAAARLTALPVGFWSTVLCPSWRQDPRSGTPLGVSRRFSEGRPPMVVDVTSKFLMRIRLGVPQ